MMIHKVFANGNEVAAEAGMNKALANFPDVCLSPPSPPAGPIPIPYPDFSFSKDLKKGSKKVKVKSKPAALKDQSYYKSSPLGDEAATRTFGANILTHQITGKTYFQMWSMDVKYEGKNVCRHFDITSSNHASKISTTATLPTAESATPATPVATEDKCPCCDGDLHANQKDPATDTKYDKMSEDDFYDSIGNYYKERRDQMQAIVDSGNVPAWALKAAKEKNPIYDGLPTKDVIIGKGNEFEKDVEELNRLRDANGDCPNVHKDKDEGCGTHFRNTKGGASEARKEFTPGVRNAAIADAKAKYGPPDPAKVAAKRVANPDYDPYKVNHKTPLDAGGCPKGPKNLVPDWPLEGDCERIEELQTKLQNAIPNDRANFK